MPQSRIYNPFVAASSGGGGSTPDYVEEIKTFPFAFNSGSPLVVLAIPTGARIIKCGIQITTVFDDASATLKVGDSVVDDRLMQIGENDPTTLASWEAHHPHQYGSMTNILLTIAPGISTQGAGVVYIEYNINS